MIPTARRLLRSRGLVRSQGRQLGGEGTPEVLEFAAAELGARMDQHGVGAGVDG
jgi:hypothetical protein